MEAIILHKTKHVHGKKHDYDLFKRTPPPVPSEVEANMDENKTPCEKEKGKRTRQEREEIQQKA